MSGSTKVTLISNAIANSSIHFTNDIISRNRFQVIRHDKKFNSKNNLILQLSFIQKIINHKNNSRFSASIVVNNNPDDQQYFLRKEVIPVEILFSESVQNEAVNRNKIVIFTGSIANFDNSTRLKISKFSRRYVVK